MGFFEKIFKKEAAQGLIEVIIAISLLSIVFTGSWQIMHDSFTSIHQEMVTLEAHYLVIEGLEGIRSIRDEDWNSIIDGTWHFRFDSGSGVLLLEPGEETVSNIFTRRIEISSVRRNTITGKITEDPTWDYDPNTKLVEVVVQWDYRGSARTDNERVYLTNWGSF